MQGQLELNSGIHASTLHSSNLLAMARAEGEVPDTSETSKLEMEHGEEELAAALSGFKSGDDEDEATTR